ETLGLAVAVVDPGVRRVAATWCEPEERAVRAVGGKQVAARVERQADGACLVAVVEPCGVVARHPARRCLVSLRGTRGEQQADCDRGTAHGLPGHPAESRSVGQRHGRLLSPASVSEKRGRTRVTVAVSGVEHARADKATVGFLLGRYPNNGAASRGRDAG